MKANKNYGKFFFPAIIFTAMLLSACIVPILDVNNIQDNFTVPGENMGQVRLNFSDSISRTIFPNTTIDSFDHFELVFTGIGNSSGLGTLTPIDITLAEIKNDDAITLTAGTYSLAVTAYMDDDKEEPAAVAVIASVSVPAGSTVNVDIVLSVINIDEDEDGIFSWDVNFSYVTPMSSAAMNITPVFAGRGTANIPEIDLLTDPKDEVTLLAGYYFVDIELERHGEDLKWRQVLHVYQFQESNFSHTFVPSEFTIRGYSVIFQFNDNGITDDIERQTLPGGTVPLPSSTEIPDRLAEGLFFGGWWTQNGGTSTEDSAWGSQFTASTAVNDRIYLWARWVAPPSGSSTFTIELQPFTSNDPEFEQVVNIEWGTVLNFTVDNASDYDKIEWFHGKLLVSDAMVLVYDTAEEMVEPTSLVNYMITHIVTIVGYIDGVPYGTNVIVNCISPDLSTGQVQFNATTVIDLVRILNTINDIPGSYTVNVLNDMEFPGARLTNPDVTVTVNGNGKTLTWRHVILPPRQNLFYVGGGNLILEDITLERYPHNNLSWPLINVRGGTAEMGDGVIIRNTPMAVFQDGGHIGVTVELDGVFTMTGGVIEGGDNGIAFMTGENAADGAEVNITGGIIQNNTRSGIAFWEGAKNSTLYISGDAEIKNNSESGISSSAGTHNNTINMSGGTISENNGSGINYHGPWEREPGDIVPGSSENILNISGGTISGNGHSGISIDGSKHEVIITGGTISSNSHHGVRVGDSSTEHVISISANTLIKANSFNGIELGQNSENITLNITGGSIENNTDGVAISGHNHTLNFSSGIIQGNNSSGIWLWESSEHTININGTAQISGNARGMNIEGTGHVINISGSAQIINNTNQQGGDGTGIMTTRESSEIELNISGDVIISGHLVGRGITILGKNYTVVISENVQIINNSRGISIEPEAENCSLTMIGGTISGTTNWGISVNGYGTIFSKTGGTVNGWEQGATDGPGAIRVEIPNFGQLLRRFDHHTTGTLAATINADRTALVSSSGDWQD